MPQRRIGVRAPATLSHRNENRRRRSGVVGSRDDGRKSRSSARYAASRRVEHDESAIARLTERPVGRAVRLMPAVAPAVAAVRCEGLADGHDDDARRDDDRRTTPTARRVADAAARTRCMVVSELSSSTAPNARPMPRDRDVGQSRNCAPRRGFGFFRRPVRRAPVSFRASRRVSPCSSLHVRPRGNSSPSLRYAGGT